MVRGVGLKWLLLGTVLCGAIRLNAQEFSEWQLEEVESGESEVLQLLEDLRRQPLAVNHATRTELLKIPFLTPEHARALVRYRQQHGPFKDWKDLETIPGWHPELAEAVRPYFNLKQKRSGPRSEIQMRLSRSGEAVSGTGSPIALQQRLVFRPVEGLRIFLATDKDPGEADWRDLTTGALSGTVARNKLSWVFGDFSWTAGQGLILSGPYGYPLAPASWQPFRHGLLDLDARHSPAENGFWRGGGGGWQVTDRIVLTGGWSRRKIDARVEPRSGWVTTLPQSGYHRTPTELAGAALLGEERRAVAGTWQTGFLTLGGLTNHLSYDIPVLSPAG
ncbi:MAG TPA: helix-hairpin-helix domain-containing protein, partial [Calditrichia bacterium]|nr:helix-hairpin-helix domain-containing protein [Calditrichia bacterium]